MPRDGSRSAQPIWYASQLRKLPNDTRGHGLLPAALFSCMPKYVAGMTEAGTVFALMDWRAVSLQPVAPSKRAKTGPQAARRPRKGKSDMFPSYLSLSASLAGCAVREWTPLYDPDNRFVLDGQQSASHCSAARCTHAKLLGASRREANREGKSRKDRKDGPAARIGFSHEANEQP